eukprot:CAMPEP_0185036480 /NCGR_PEP_ID=MMETSP1103-20130426/29556_1 /TAXON_ID=36769 /ORGANISM="Paraphysomonas bandaiensis, Strain Caron Lab Isolate" /LENGTH=261 /DNA_ID=CAMNT_0027574027 /DNA_START=74 /DNA_END=859 /DNA_ORIENTATION=+
MTLMFGLSLLSLILTIVGVAGTSKEQETVVDVNWAYAEVDDIEQGVIRYLYVGLNMMVYDGFTFVYKSCREEFCSDCLAAGSANEVLTALALICITLVMCCSIVRLFIDSYLIWCITSASSLLSVVLSLITLCVFSDCYKAVDLWQSRMRIYYGPGFVSMLVTMFLMVAVGMFQYLVPYNGLLERGKVGGEWYYGEDNENENDGENRISYDPTNDEELPAAWRRSSYLNSTSLPEGSQRDNIPVAVPVLEAVNTHPVPDQY